MKLKPFGRKVCYYETDKMGIVHHSNYILWFEEARIDFIEQAGMSFDYIESQGVLSPVLSVECNYKIPFKFNEQFYIRACIPYFNGMRFTFEYEVYDSDGVVRVTGRTTHCFIDKDMRPLRVKKTHPHIYSAVYEAMCAGKEELFGCESTDTEEEKSLVCEK